MDLYVNVTTPKARSLELLSVTALICLRLCNNEQQRTTTLPTVRTNQSCAVSFFEIKKEILILMNRKSWH